MQMKACGKKKNSLIFKLTFSIFIHSDWSVLAWETLQFLLWLFLKSGIFLTPCSLCGKIHLLEIKSRSIQASEVVLRGIA